MVDRIAESTRKMLQDCEPRNLGISSKYPGLTWIGPEVLCSVHGLETLDSRVQRYVRKKAIVDIGAFNGDSAVLLRKYAKDVYSFEPSPSSFRMLSRVAKLNRKHFGKIHPVNMGLSDKPDPMVFDDARSSCESIGKHNTTVNVTTLDLFVDQHRIHVGFIKCDTEGHALRIVRGAERTLRMHRPVVALSVYHNVDEMFGIPPLLQQWLPNYHFAWNFPMKAIRKWNELLYIGYPNEALSS
jgi:FkbM family methyltransferase